MLLLLAGEGELRRTRSPADGRVDGDARARGTPARGRLLLALGCSGLLLLRAREEKGGSRDTKWLWPPVDLALARQPEAMEAGARVHGGGGPMGVLVEVVWLAGNGIEEVALGDAVGWMDRLKTVGIGQR